MSSFTNKGVKVDNDVQDLKLPLIGHPPKGEKYNILDRQTYTDFATKAMKMNPEFRWIRRSSLQPTHSLVSLLRIRVSNMIG